MNFRYRAKNLILNLAFVVFVGAILMLSIRGFSGNPTSDVIGNPEWTLDGPLELSPERGRFALTFSLVENHSFSFSLPIARFATPDLGYINENYVSLFPPAVSFIIIPGYLLGKMFGISQVGSYSVVALFGLLNVLLIRAISMQLGANKAAAIIGSIAFLFATPAFAYSVSLYQHHFSTFIILASVYVLLKYRGLVALFVVWFLLALSIPIDNPNFFLVLPVVIYAGWRVFSVRERSKSFSIEFKPFGIVTFLFAAIPVAFLLWFNFNSYGNPFQLSGTVGAVKAIDDQGRPTVPEVGTTEDLQALINPETQDKSAIGFFRTRNLLNGFYTHILSPDRGVVYYAPIMILGLFGIYYAYKSNLKMFSVLISLILINVLVYSLWGDPWGGWAFGSRYLIPSYAVMSIFIATLLSRFRKNITLSVIFLILFGFSSFVNTAGALTSNKNPPKTEILALEKITNKEEKYTVMRNIDKLSKNESKSFVYQTYASNYVSANQYQFVVFLSIFVVVGLFIIDNNLSKNYLIDKGNKNEHK